MYIGQSNLCQKVKVIVQWNHIFKKISEFYKSEILRVTKIKNADFFIRQRRKLSVVLRKMKVFGYYHEGVWTKL